MPIPDEALVARGGLNTPADLLRGTGVHPSGVVGVSVQCAENVSVEQLAAKIPHGQIGITRVGDIRIAGGDVVRTSGRGKYHATLAGAFAGGGESATDADRAQSRASSFIGVTMVHADRPKILVDFNNADVQDRVRLETVGSLADLSRQQVHLSPGTMLLLYTPDADSSGVPGELQVFGLVEFDNVEGWVATIDWAHIRFIPTDTPVATAKPDELKASVA